VRERVEAVIADPRVRRAFDFLSRNESRIQEDQVRLTSIPAPPFAEAERAGAFAAELRDMGLSPESDGIGNVVAAYESLGGNPVVVGAHLDTVFPAATPLALHRKGRIIHLPGISDNGSGIVALLWVLRAAKAAGLRFRRPVVAVGNVGEEGEGNLRGIRHLFNAPPWGSRECEFIAVDGAGLQRITNQALGSRRFRVSLKGPGGHSWADFGKPNPVHVLATAIHLFVSNGVARRPGASFNVGVIRGGISVNAIPSEALMEVDLRSATPSNLEALDRQLKTALNEAASSVDLERRTELMGERPSGTTSPSAAIVRASLEATRLLGAEPQLDIGSTDANIPMSMGIPAIAIGGGGRSGDVHTPQEWFDPTGRDLGLQRLLTVIGVLAGLEDDH
jgi:tripeptide aminopeptidase